MKNENADVIGYSVKSLYIYADSLPERQMKTSMIINLFNSVSVLDISGEIIFDEIEFLDNSSICKLILHGNGYDAVQIKKMAELYPNVEIITG